MGYFLGPGGGGICVAHEGREVTVITSTSPVGQQLLKRQEGAIFMMLSGSRRLRTVIFSVC